MKEGRGKTNWKQGERRKGGASAAGKKERRRKKALAGRKEGIEN
jgi:hypothetical protein